MPEPVSTTAMAIKAAPYILAALKTGSSIIGSHYGGKQSRRQQEENERAEARAAMISALTGQRATAQPQIMNSPGASAAGTIGNISDIGMNLLPYLPRSVSTPSVPTVTAGNIQNPGPGPLSGLGRTDPSNPYS